MSYLFNATAILCGRAPRTGRTAERASHTILRALHVRNEVAMLPAGGGSADTPARTLRTRTPTTRTGSKASDDSDDDGGDGPVRPYVLSAVAHEGITVRTADGRPAALAVIDADGHVLADEVAHEAWSVAVHAYRQFLQGSGHLKVHFSPPGGLVTPECRSSQ